MAVVAGIDSVAADFGVEGELLDWARNSSEEWDNIKENARIETAEKHIAFADFREKQEECRKHYYKVKDLLKSIIARSDNADEIMKVHSIEGRTPR